MHMRRRAVARAMRAGSGDGSGGVGSALGGGTRAMSAGLGGGTGGVSSPLGGGTRAMSVGSGEFGGALAGGFRAMDAGLGCGSGGIGSALGGGSGVGSGGLGKNVLGVARRLVGMCTTYVQHGHGARHGPVQCICSAHAYAVCARA